MRGVEENKNIAIVCIVLGSISQLFFQILELIEVYYKGFITYFSQIFNIFQFVQLLMFLSYGYFHYKIMNYGTEGFYIAKDVPLDTWRFCLQISEAFLTIGIFF
jgi:hypothetical protein